jgi:hypothetical protein
MIDYRSFTVKVLESEVLQLKEKLLSISPEEIRKKQVRNTLKFDNYHAITQPLYNRIAATPHRTRARS